MNWTTLGRLWLELAITRTWSIESGRFNTAIRNEVTNECKMGDGLFRSESDSVWCCLLAMQANIRAVWKSCRTRRAVALRSGARIWILCLECKLSNWWLSWHTRVCYCVLGVERKLLQTSGDCWTLVSVAAERDKMKLDSSSLGQLFSSRVDFESNSNWWW